MPDTFPRGRIVWHELMTTDPEAAAEFYRRVIGWGVTPFEQDPVYRMWTMEGTLMGGLMQLPEEARQMGAPPHWLMYVLVPDVDAVLRQAVMLGGRTYVEPMDIPNVGRFAVLADPQGAVFAVFRPTGEGGGSDEAMLGDFSWHELATSDSEQAWTFYQALFGWEHTESFDMGPGGRYLMFARTGSKRTLGGMYRMPPEMAAPPHWLCYVRVKDADRAAELAARMGGRVVNGPMEVPGGDRVAQCIDPQGAVFAVHSVAVEVVKPADEPVTEKAKTRPKAKRTAKAKPKQASKARPKRTAAKTAKARAVKPKAGKARPTRAARPKSAATSKRAAPGRKKAKPKTGKARPETAKRKPTAVKAKKSRAVKTKAGKAGAAKRTSRTSKKATRSGGKRKRR